MLHRVIGSSEIQKILSFEYLKLALLFELFFRKKRLIKFVTLRIWKSVESGYRFNVLILALIVLLLRIALVLLWIMLAL